MGWWQRKGVALTPPPPRAGWVEGVFWFPHMLCLAEQHTMQHSKQQEEKQEISHVQAHDHDGLAGEQQKYSSCTLVIY